MQHGARGHADQVAAVVDALDVHAGRQQAAGVDSLDLALDALDRRARLGAAAHQHDALHDVVVVVAAGDAESGLVADADGRDVADVDRHALVRRERGAAHVLHAVDEADAANHGRLGPDVDRLAADVDVGVAERLQHLRQSDPVAGEPALVDGDLVGLGLAAPAGDVDDAGHGLEAALEHPVLQRLEIGDRVALRAGDPVAEDLADRARRRDRRLRAVRQLRQLREAVDDPLLGLLVGEVVGELHLDVREPEQRDRADRLDVRDAGHLHFDRNRDVALDLLGRLAARLRHDVDERRHRVRVGLDVERREARGAGAEHEHEQRGHEHALSQGEGDQRVHRQSCRAARSMKRLPRVTTRSPACRPSRTSTKPSLVRPTRISRRPITSPSRTTQTWLCAPS